MTSLSEHANTPKRRPKINNFIRFKVCPKINNIEHKQGTLSSNTETNHGCMQMITAKSKRYARRKEIRWEYMCLLTTFLIYVKTFGNLFIMGQGSKCDLLVDIWFLLNLLVDTRSNKIFILFWFRRRKKSCYFSIFAFAHFFSLPSGPPLLRKWSKAYLLGQ
jgi:hypothetical protein